MHRHHPMANPVLAPHQANVQWPAVSREHSPVPAAFYKKENSQVIVAAPDDDYQAGVPGFLHNYGYRHPVLENKENSFYVIGAAEPKVIQDSPQRISKSKIGITQNTSKFLSPKGKFEADRMLTVRNENVENLHSHTTLHNERSRSTSPTPLRFKFKVYPTKIEKCQIDDLGNEIPGGIVELIQSKIPSAPRSERIRVNDIVLPPGVKLICSKYINLPLPHESQERLSENIARYNSIIEHQQYLASQIGQNDQVWHQMQQAEEQRIALAKDQIHILSQFVPSDQLLSQMIGADYMASIPMVAHPANNIQTSVTQGSSKGNSLVTPANMTNVLGFKHQEIKKCVQNHVQGGSPNVFESFSPSYNDKSQEIAQCQKSEVVPGDFNDNFGETSKQYFNSFQPSRHLVQASGVVCTQIETDRDESGSSKSRDTDAFRRLYTNKPDESRIRPENFENYVQLSTSEVTHQHFKGDNQDHRAAVASKDFNDWIEKGLFRQIHSLNTAVHDKSSTLEKKGTILSQIAEVPEEKSESSPMKFTSSAKKDTVSVHCIGDDSQRNGTATPITLNKSKSAHFKDNNFNATSNYPQEHMEIGMSKRSMSNEALDELAKASNPAFDNRSMIPVPIFTSQNPSGENRTETDDPSRVSTPVKMMGAVYVSNPNRLSYQGPQFSHYAIKEANMEDEEEVPQDMRVKEMTPPKSANFQAHRINTDCSPSVSGNDHSQVLQGANFNMVFPSLRFSSAKPDKSIQVRASINVIEGQSLKFEGNNFIYLDQNEPSSSNINAYMIEPINLMGAKRSQTMLDEGVQTEGVSPFIASQIVQELLRSKDFAAEIKNADPNQGFTVTVTQDQANNDFVIDVQMSADDNELLAAKLDQMGTNTDGMRLPTERNSISDMDHQLKIVSKTESIKEMSEFGHTSLLLNFDFTKKEMFDQTQRLAFDQHVGIKTITENEEQENSPDRSDCLEDDQVTIDNPLMKEFDATASPDKHARNSRLEEILEHGGYKSVTSEMIGCFSNLDSDKMRANSMAVEEKEYFQSASKMVKAPLYHITEQSIEDSEQLRISRQNNLNSIEGKDNQSEVFNSKVYEKLFGEQNQVSEKKFDRHKKGAKSMTAYHSKELNTICEESHLANEQTHSFVEFLAKQEQKASIYNSKVGATETPSKKLLEIEDLIMNISENKGRGTNEKYYGNRLGKESSVKKAAVQQSAVIFDHVAVEPLSIQSVKEHIYVIRMIEAKSKKSKSDKTTKRGSTKSRSKSKSVKGGSIRNTEINNDAKISEENQITDDCETICLKIPEEIHHTQQDKVITPHTSSKKDVTTQRASKESKPYLNRRSPTPTRGKADTTVSDAKSVNKIKKDISNDNISYTSNHHSALSPMTAKTQKKSTTPNKPKDVSMAEKSKPARRETSPYAPEKYKSTIQTLFHDQMGPAKKSKVSKTPSRAEKQKANPEKPAQTKIDSSFTQFNQASDCETNSITSGHNKDFTRHHRIPSEKVKTYNSTKTNQNDSFSHGRHFTQNLECDSNKSHRSTRSHMPANTIIGMGPLFENVVAERNTAERNGGFLKSASSNQIASGHRTSASMKKATSPQIGVPERLMKTQKAPESNSLSKNSQGKQSTQTFGYPDQGRSKQNSQRHSVMRNSAADNILRDKILNEFITGLCATGVLNEEDCANENFFIENEAIMINFDSMVAICAEMGFLPEEFDPEDDSFAR